MRKEEVVEFDYEGWIRGNPGRYKTLDKIRNIITGHINTARYYCKYKWCEDAKVELQGAHQRIDIFVEDLENESSSDSIPEVNSLRELVSKAEVELFGKLMLRSNQAEQREGVLTV